MRECVSSGEDVSVNTVIILRNWRAILADLRSEATEEASIAPQFWGMMTVFTDTSDPELTHSHCYNVNTTHFLDLWLLHMSILVLSTPTKKQYLLRIAFFGGYIVLNLFSTVYRSDFPKPFFINVKLAIARRRSLHYLEWASNMI